LALAWPLFTGLRLGDSLIYCGLRRQSLPVRIEQEQEVIFAGGRSERIEGNSDVLVIQAEKSSHSNHRVSDLAGFGIEDKVLDFAEFLGFEGALPSCR
jgi:hypothetical protein